MISKNRLKFLQSLRRKKARREAGVLLVEGLNVVEEAARAGQVRELYLSDALADDPRVRALAGAGHAITSLTERDVTALTETKTPAGVFALVADPSGRFEPNGLSGDAFVLVAAGVADPGNLGTLIRTAAAFGLDALLTTAGTVEPTNPKVVRASAGMLFQMPVRHAEVAQLAGFTTLVADTGGGPLASWNARPRRLALVVGNEPHGVEASVRTRADDTVAVTMRAGVESLNVAVAAGILMHAFVAMQVEA